MNTFLPFPGFCESAQVLDLSRLGKQIIEAGQVLRALEDSSYGWQNHPAVNMWRGYTSALWVYTGAMTAEWVDRRDKMHMAYPNVQTWFRDRKIEIRVGGPKPPWLGDPDFHAAHRSNLLRKDPEWYGEFPWNEPDDLSYIWPVNERSLAHAELG